MPDPYGVSSYQPQSSNGGGYLTNPFQQNPAQFGPAMGGPPPSPMGGSPMMMNQAPQRRDAAGNPNPTGQAYSDPFSSQQQFQQAPLGYQAQPGTTGMEAPYTIGTGTGFFGGQPVSSGINVSQGAHGSPQYNAGQNAMSNWQNLFSLANNGVGAVGDQQALPGAGSSWQNFQGQMGNYMNNLNAWNGQYSNTPGNESAAPILQNLAGYNPGFFGPAATQTNYGQMYGNAQSQYNGVYNQYLNQGQFGLTGAQAGGQPTVGGR